MMILSAALWMSAAAFASDHPKLTQKERYELDSNLFIKPYIESELQGVSGQLVLDAGCGLAPHAILAAQKGAQVCAFETKKGLLDQAKLAIRQAGVESQVALTSQDFEHLSYPSNSFDLAMCVDAERRIPTTMHLVKENKPYEIGLGVHFKEMARVMKAGGKLVVAAPASYGVVFSDGTQPEEVVQQHIQSVLASIGTNQDPVFISEKLSELEEVMRATFVHKDGALTLVTDESLLTVGQKIWCKVPKEVLSSFYHSEEEYLIALTAAGLNCEEIKRPCFFGSVKYNQWRTSPHVCGQSLGEGYISHNPFTIYYATKRA